MVEEQTKRCPFCGEEILTVAVKCRFCHTMLDGSTPHPDPTPAPDPTPSSGMVPEWVAGTAPIPEGTEIQNYRIVRMLGKGGMGEVYLAHHTYTDQRVALKAVSPALMADKASRRRFLEEGRVMARMKHENIVRLHNFFEEMGRFFLVMEYVHGESLADVLARQRDKGKRLPIDWILQVATGMLAGVAYANALDPVVVHRDIKPANVMLDTKKRVFVTDFGLAKAVGREQLTRTRGIVGTYEYMSPEQVMGEPVSPASDVYSLGITLYEMIAGVVPFPQNTETGMDAMEGHRYKPPPPIADKRPDCPAWLADVVYKALVKAPSARYADAGEMLAAIEAGGAEPEIPVEVSPEPPAEPSAQPVRTPTPIPEKRPAPPAEPEPEPLAELYGESSHGRRKKWPYVLALLIVLASVIAVVPYFTTFRTFQVTFVSNPEGAQLRVDGQPYPDTPHTVELRIGEHTVVMYLPDHQTRKERVVINADETIEWSLKPTMHDVEFTSVPSGLNVLVDEVSVCTTPCTHQVTQGTHKLMIAGTADYDSQKRTIRIVYSNRKQSFEPQARLGSLRVTVTDSLGNSLEADVLIDGKSAGKSPGPFEVAAGAHEVVAAASDYPGRKVEVEVGGGEETVVSVKLVMAMKPGKKIAVSSHMKPGMGNDKGAEKKKKKKRKKGKKKKRKKKKGKKPKRRYSAVVKYGTCKLTADTDEKQKKQIQAIRKVVEKGYAHLIVKDSARAVNLLDKAEKLLGMKHTSKATRKACKATVKGLRKGVIGEYLFLTEMAVYHAGTAKNAAGKSKHCGTAHRRAKDALRCGADADKVKKALGICSEDSKEGPMEM